MSYTAKGKLQYCVNPPIEIVLDYWIGCKFGEKKCFSNIKRNVAIFYHGNKARIPNRKAHKLPIFFFNKAFNKYAPFYNSQYTAVLFALKSFSLFA